jgi:hypothetical protein
VPAEEERKRMAMEAQVTALRAAFEAEAAEAAKIRTQDQTAEARLAEDRNVMAQSQYANASQGH